MMCMLVFKINILAIIIQGLEDPSNHKPKTQGLRFGFKVQISNLVCFEGLEDESSNSQSQGWRISNPQRIPQTSNLKLKV